jgi:uncharacterized surface protein with fasciclin (FAS1) repeats
MASSAANATSNYTAGVAQEAGTRAQNLLANATFTNLAGQAFPAVRTAMNQLTSSGRNLDNSYATFTAVGQAAEDAVKNNGNVNSGRRLLQNGSTSGNVGGSGMGKPAITVFAPSDQAIQTYLQQQGLTQQQLLGNKEQLVELISYHIVPLQALSTRYLASRSRGRVQTLLPNNSLAFTAMNITVAGNPSSVVLLQDAIGSASVYDLDFNDGRVSEPWTCLGGGGDQLVMLDCSAYLEVCQWCSQLVWPTDKVYPYSIFLTTLVIAYQLVIAGEK